MGLIRIFSAMCAVMILGGCAQAKPMICFEAVCYEVEIADSDIERQRGLMFRDHLDADNGMLFIFDSVGEYPFWMKNTKIPLDIIWLDPDFTITRIRENVPPCLEDPCPRIDPDAEALYVLELNAGEAQRLDLSVGQRAAWR